MAALKHNGFEVARLKKVEPMDDGIGESAVEYSIRSTGWVLRKAYWIRPDGTKAAGHWTRLKRFPTETSTLSQWARHMVETREFAYVEGGPDDVLRTQSTLARKRIAGPYEEVSA